MLINVVLIKNTQVEYVNKISNWAIEDGKLHGFGYERCDIVLFTAGYTHIY